ncbi:SpoIIE family protein phosphatase [Streptomyces sp. NPDC055103]
MIQRGAEVTPVAFADPSLPVNLAGLAENHHRIEEVHFGPGDRMLLYTDGVSETRDRAGTFYPLVTRLSGWAREPAAELPGLLHTDLAAYGADGLDDDVAALLVVPRASPAEPPPPDHPPHPSRRPQTWGSGRLVSFAHGYVTRAPFVRSGRSDPHT